MLGEGDVVEKLVGVVVWVDCVGVGVGFAVMIVVGVGETVGVEVTPGI